jgi:hypothetical protein
MGLEDIKRLILGKCVFCNKALPKGYKETYCKQCAKSHKHEIKQLDKQVRTLGF